MSFQLSTRSKDTSVSIFVSSTLAFILFEPLDKTELARERDFMLARVFSPSQVISGVDGVVETVVVDTEVPVLDVELVASSSSRRRENCCC